MGRYETRAFRNATTAQAVPSRALVPLRYEKAHAINKQEINTINTLKVVKMSDGAGFRLCF